jgi:hypothetical protein
VAITVVDVAQRRLDVRVPHPGLNRRHLGAAHRERPISLGNTSSSSPTKSSRSLSRASARATSGTSGTERTLPLFGVPTPP